MKRFSDNVFTLHVMLMFYCSHGILGDIKFGIRFKYLSDNSRAELKRGDVDSCVLNCFGHLVLPYLW